jgi:hypothetical protein
MARMIVNAYLSRERRRRPRLADRFRDDRLARGVTARD